MIKIQGDFNEKNPAKVRVQRNPRLEPELKVEDLERGELVGQGEKGLARNCFVYDDKLVNITHQHLTVHDYKDLLNGKSASM